MAKEATPKPLNPLQLAGAVILTVGSIGLFIHRLPHHEFAAVHEDVAPRQRPKAAADIVFLAVPAQAATPVPAARVPQKPAYRAPERFPEEPAESFAALPVSVDWTEDCVSEIGILCHAVPDKRLNSCLRGYEDALLRPCRRALDRRFPVKRAPEDEP